MIGYSRKELVGKTTLALARLLTNKGLSIYWKNPLKRTEEFSSVPHEVDVFKKNGELITVRINCQQLKTDSKMMGHLIILENLTELKHKERKSNEYLEVYKSLVNHVEIGIYRATPGINGRFLQVNKAMEAITGYSHEELLRIDIEDLYVSPEERSEHIRETLLGSTAKTREVKFKKKDGTHIIVRDKKVAVHSNDGKNLYLDGFLEDISEIKKTEKALRDSEQNLLPQIYLI
jgi:PAS domain S-box-containing protein